MSASEAMSSADAAWLHMDRPTNLMVITGALWFDEPLDWDRGARGDRHTPGRPLPALPPAGQSRAACRCAARAGRTTPTSTSTCICTTPPCRPPATAPRCRSSSATSSAQPLDRSRPLWHWYLVDGYGAGSAIVARMHHCIADGIALARVLLSLTDATPDAGIEPEEPASSPTAAGSAAGRRRRSPRPARRLAGRDVAGARSPTRRSRWSATPPSWSTSPARPATTPRRSARRSSPGPTRARSSRASWGSPSGSPGPIRSRSTT